MAFLWIPLVIIALYAFNSSNIQSWPIPGWTLHWFRVAWHNDQARQALWLSVEVGLVTTGTTANAAPNGRLDAWLTES